MKKPMIQLENVTKIYRSGKLKVVALDEVSLEIYQKDFISIVGTSGAGKSTMLHLIGALDKPTRGTVKVNGADLSTLSDDELALFRKENVGFVFQFFNLIPTLTALENVVVSKMFDDDVSISKAEDVLKKVGLAKKVDRKPNELSGGEQQRVAIARALFNDPEIILADEPTGNIDTQTGYELLKLFRKLNRSGTTMVLVTHDAQIARAGNRVVKMRDGKIVTK
jgi:putative ABC transport system ATP-binding protein